MLNLNELRRAARLLNARLAGARLDRIVQPDDFSLVLVFRAPAGSTAAMLSCRPEFARICVTEEVPPALPSPPSFAQFMRAHLLRSTFESAGAAPNDRRMTMRLATHEGGFHLVLSLLGARSNIYLLDSSEKLVHSLRPLETTRSELKLGEPWKDPERNLRNDGVDRWPGVPDDRYLENIGETYRLLERKKEIETLARRVGTGLTKEEAFLERKMANLQEDLADARQAEEFRRKGELLKGALHEIRPGDDAVSVIDYLTGERVRIPLRSELSPAENLEAYFARYQKESRGAAAIERQLGEVRLACAGLEALREELRKIVSCEPPDIDRLRTFSTDTRVRKLLSKYYPSRPARTPPAGPQGRGEVPGRLLPKRYRTAQGLEIWVGRSDEGNDYLTTRLARGNDLFFHLEGYPGSHVVLRTEGRKDPPPESILDACELAVHFSRLKQATRADVHVTQIKNVKKPKGAKPGMVYVLRGRTVHLRRNPKRLEDILASRQEE